MSGTEVYNSTTTAAEQNKSRCFKVPSEHLDKIRCFVKMAEVVSDPCLLSRYPMDAGSSLTLQHKRCPDVSIKGPIPGTTDFHVVHSSSQDKQLHPGGVGVQLEHPHTVPADGAVGVEVEGHQVFWTYDDKPSILVLTAVPPHTDSLGVSTKTKAGLVTEDDPLPF
ncbi:hypothetical protein NFI96_022084 [Prochilodus magdalenae]|nr:hypothetical protein NFI96_022084 [Prochilodus magdalenae]